MPATPNKGFDKKVQKAEEEYRRLMSAGKITPQNREKIKKQIVKKYGVYPLGDTN